jgi:NADH:ubiquinone oxidoreductase subunit 5 (subunit L)/multisubunit Na+/H+ antiporter MnhA subunit
MVAAGGYLLLRLSPVLHASGWGAGVAAWVGAVTALVLGAVACVQRDLKQLLAASTCAQVGFMVLAAGAGSVAGGAAHLAGHAAVKSLLFLCAGAWLGVLGSKDLDRLRGAGRRTPLIGVVFAIGALALAGVPPLALWVTKDLALSGAPTALLLVGLAASALSAVYAGRALFIVLAPATDRNRSRRRVAVGMLAALIGLALPAAGWGVAVLAWPGWAPHLEPVDAVMSAAAGLAGLTLAAAWGRRGTPLPARVTTAGVRWLGLEFLARRVIVGPTWWLARALAAFDDRVLAAGVQGVARFGRTTAKVVDAKPERGLTTTVATLARGGRALASAVDGAVERTINVAVAAVAAGGRRLGVLARRPQTGQLHQYYAQAAVVLVALALVFVLVVG